MATDVEFQDRIPKIIVDVNRRTARAEEKAAQKIAREAKMRAPRLNRIIAYPTFSRYPGQMADSITVGDHDDGTGVFVGAYWGLFVEEGTRHMDAQPFLLPAAIANEAELVGDVELELTRL